jgi:hypothetical protein
MENTFEESPAYFNNNIINSSINNQQIVYQSQTEPMFINNLAYEESSNLSNYSNNIENVSKVPNNTPLNYSPTTHNEYTPNESRSWKYIGNDEYFEDSNLKPTSLYQVPSINPYVKDINLENKEHEKCSHYVHHGGLEPSRSFILPAEAQVLSQRSISFEDEEDLPLSMSQHLSSFYRRRDTDYTKPVKRHHHHSWRQSDTNKFKKHHNYDTHDFTKKDHDHHWMHKTTL